MSQGAVDDRGEINDILFLRASDNAIWMWNQQGWTFTGGWLPGLVAGDNQFFGIGFDGQVWRFNVVGGWTRSGGYGASIDVGNDGDANPSNDIIFLLSADSRLWTWDQQSWNFTGGWLPSVTAGDNQAFGLGFDGQLWRCRVSGPDELPGRRVREVYQVFAAAHNLFEVGHGHAFQRELGTL